jgi:ArsR family transcriptional regulator
MDNEERVKKVKKVMPKMNVIYDVSDFFKIVGDSTRLRILMSLGCGELCVSDISNVLDMSISAISHQLKALREAKLVKIRKDGKIVYYSLDDDHIKKLLDVSFEHVNEK